METKEQTAITIKTTVNAPVEKVWKLWTIPHHIAKWCHASDDWYAPYAENDLKKGSNFLTRMSARDGSVSFDFNGKYDKIAENREIQYTIADGRKVKVLFEPEGSSTTITEIFDPESINSIELQKSGWQSILDNFKKYAESSDKHEILHFDILIDAPVNKVYTRMIEDKYYREWTSVFNETSKYEGSWEKGSKILFIGTDENGNKGGMVSHIRENIRDKFISIEHQGILKGDQEIMSGSDVDSWAGALENYTFENKDGRTLLKVDMDSNDDFKSYFEEKWPLALKKLKEICEK
jgi:uncharacterized protein YndB with AHSA1/START domain